MNTPRHPEDPARAVQALIAAYEQLRPDTLHELLALYAEDAHFKDPFNEVSGRSAIARIFSHMFQVLHLARFEFVHSAVQGQDAFLTWNFHLQRHAKSAPLCIHGATHLRLTTQGLVQLHRDYWDAAEELYAKLPLLGALMRTLQRQLRCPQT
ncbi:nuclear transport factor 2 family protein [Roseateles sp. BYS180W]|uniref:Nuclear transport factor 2 family protein n=1 Tax=Roseateles rivi TaxID=3299028 RepID=A0ABW7FS40_9BURK